MNESVKEFDVVYVDGRKGTVVFIHKNDNPDCEVEFYNDGGNRFTTISVKKVRLTK